MVKLTKSWVITMLPFILIIGFGAYTMVTGHDMTQAQLDFVDKLVVLGLGSGAIGATKSAHDAIIASKQKPTS